MCKDFMCIDLTECVMMVTKKTAFLGNRGQKTARQAAELAPTGKPKVSKVASGYGEVMIPLSLVRLSPKKGGYMGVA